MSSRGTVGVKDRGRVLELPSGNDAAGGEAGLAPPGRARLRLNLVTSRAEISIDENAYEPIVTGDDESPWVQNGNVVSLDDPASVDDVEVFANVSVDNANAYVLQTPDPDGDFRWSTGATPNAQGPDNQVSSVGWNVTAGANRLDPDEPAAMMTFESDFFIGAGPPEVRYCEIHWQFQGTDGINRRPLSCAFDRVSNAIVGTNVQGTFIVQSAGATHTRLQVQDGTGRGNAFWGTQGGEATTCVFAVHDVPMLESINEAGNAFHQILKYSTQNELQIASGFARGVRCFAPLVLNPLTVAQANALPGTLGIATGSVIFCSNGDAGSPCLAVWDGSGTWKRVALGAAISAT